MDEKVRERQAQFELREWTLGQILDHTVARYPDNEAVVYADRSYRQTWREFGEMVDRFAKGLMALAVEKAERMRCGHQCALLGGPAVCHSQDRGCAHYSEHQLPRARAALSAYPVRMRERLSY